VKVYIDSVQKCMEIEVQEIICKSVCLIITGFSG